MIDKHIPLPSREAVTSMQVNTLLTIVGTLTSAILHAETSAQEGGSRDGGTKAAAEGTLIEVYNRLDSILAEKNRWSLSSQEHLEKRCEEVYTAHLSLIKAQKAAVEAMTAPHKKVIPALVHLNDGRWAAVVGDLTKPDASIIGVGNCPEAALEDFDSVFKGKQTATTVVVEPLPTDETNLDPGPTETTDNPTKRRKNKRSDSEDTGKD
jgi:hypothetical protein